MRPFSPVPLTVLRSRSSSRASRRTAGPAKTPEKSALAGPEAGARGGGRSLGATGEVSGASAASSSSFASASSSCAEEIGAAGPPGVEFRDEGAHGYLVADLGDELGNFAGRRRRHVHRRLVGFERHQRLLGLDRVAHLHQDFDDRHVLEVADVRDGDVDRRRLGRRGRGGGLGGGRRGGLGRGQAALAGAAVRAASPPPSRCGR